VTGVQTCALPILAAFGQIIGSNGLGFTPFAFAGMLGWGPGLTAAATLITIWFKKEGQPSG
jgi:hypothetical protein